MQFLSLSVFLKLLQIFSNFIYTDDTSDLSFKCRISATRSDETPCIFLIFLIVTVQISMKCEAHES